MSEEAPPARKRGRPRATKPLDKAGLGSFLSARISTEVREALEAEADRTGRSISQVAERWLDEARKGRADLIGMLGGMALAPAIARLVDIAREVDGRATHLSPSLRRTAFIGAWKAAASVAFPPVLDADIQRLRSAYNEERAATRAVYQALEDRAHLVDDPVIIQARAPIFPRIEVGLMAGAEGPMVAAVLKGYSEGYESPENAMRALMMLSEAGDTCATEVRAAIIAIDRLLDLEREYEERRKEALALGEGVAAEFAALERTGV